MAKKPAGKNTADSKKKLLKSKAKPGNSQGSRLLSQWLQDASLENLSPVQAFGKGERHLEFSASANRAAMPQQGQTRLELRLRAHIHTQEFPLALAEIKYAAVVNVPQPDQDMAPYLAEIYPFARDALARLLQLSGHEPPLPESIQV